MLVGLDIYFAMGSKDALVDLLLAEGFDDFYFFPCSRYSAGALLISAEEQVSARREFGLFRLFAEEETARELSVRIKETMKEKSIRMFVRDVREL